MSKVLPLNCHRCGRFVGKDGDPDVMYDWWSGAYEVGYSRCGRCLREDQAAPQPGASGEVACPACADGWSRTQDHACALGENGGWGASGEGGEG